MPGALRPRRPGTAGELPREEFKARSGGPSDVEIVSGCDHFYNGREEAVQAIVSSWLARTLKLDATRQQMPSSL